MSLFVCLEWILWQEIPYISVDNGIYLPLFSYTYSLKMSETTLRARRPSHLRSNTSPDPSSLHTLLTEQEASNATRTRPPTASFLLKWADLEEWQRDNHYILSHYRPATYSYMGCFQSLFYLHNESVNIHSHLLGAFVFLFTAVSVYTIEKHSASAADVAAFGCFFLGAVICLGISAGYHAVTNHSPAISRFGNQLDYVGIVALITGSFVPSVYYGLYCEPFLQKVYWAMVRIRKKNLTLFPNHC